MKTLNKFKLTGQLQGMAILAALCVVLAWPANARNDRSSGSQRQFATPEDAIKALREAAQAGDKQAMHEIFGPKIHDLMTGDEVQDRTNFAAFSKAVEESCKPEAEGDNSITLNIGKDNWPFPIPLEKKHEMWFFDTAAGKEEIINRHIGQGELNAIAVCRDYVEAQKKYFSKDRDGSGVMKYAQKFKSTAGMKDGLFWEKGNDQEGGPLKARVIQAHEEGYGTNTSAGPHVYHGYYFRILTAQSSAAPGGKMSYVENGNMTKGFALVAYPEKWGRSGIMTFIVGQDGKVYQRNLGKESSHIGAHMTEYNPDRKWKLEEDAGIAAEE